MMLVLHEMLFMQFVKTDQRILPKHTEKYLQTQQTQAGWIRCVEDINQLRSTDF